MDKPAQKFTAGPAAITLANMQSVEVVPAAVRLSVAMGAPGFYDQSCSRLLYAKYWAPLRQTDVDAAKHHAT